MNYFYCEFILIYYKYNIIIKIDLFLIYNMRVLISNMGNASTNKLIDSDTATYIDIYLYKAIRHGAMNGVYYIIKKHKNINPNATIQSLPIFFYIPLFYVNNKYSHEIMPSNLISKINFSLIITENYNLVCDYKNYKLIYKFLKYDQINKTCIKHKLFVPLKGLEFEEFLNQFGLLTCNRLPKYIYKYTIDHIPISYINSWKKKLTCISKLYNNGKKKRLPLSKTESLYPEVTETYINIDTSTQHNKGVCNDDLSNLYQSDFTDVPPLTNAEPEKDNEYNSKTTMSSTSTNKLINPFHLMVPPKQQISLLTTNANTNTNNNISHTKTAISSASTNIPINPFHLMAPPKSQVSTLITNANVYVNEEVINL